MPGSPRLFSLTRELSRHHELVLATFSSSPERYEAFQSDPEGADVYRRVVLLPGPPEPSWAGQQWHRLHMAAHFETRYRHREYHRALILAVRDLCVEERSDVLYVDSLRMCQYTGGEARIPTVADLHDSLTLLATRLLDSATGPLERFQAYFVLSAVRRLERSLADSCDLLVTNSPVDEAVIKELAATSETLTITNGVDTEFFSPDGREESADKLVFTGVMSYQPNEDAALFFARDIFPLVKAARPKAEFWIVGAQPSGRVQDLTRIAGVHVTGKVEDVRPFVRSAALFVCPLRVGAGVKNKLLAAMAMRKATVATTLSIQGLDLADNSELLLADGAEAFATKVIHLLSHPDEARRLASNGCTRVQERYSWATMGQSLDAALRRVVDERRRHGRG